MLARILTGLVGIPLILGLLYVGKWPLFALVAGMGLIGFHEYARMWRAKQVQVLLPVGWAAVLALFFQAALAPNSGLYLGLIIAATLMAVLSWLLFAYERLNVLDALVTISGVGYVGWLLSHLLLLRNLGGGSGWDAGLKWTLLAFFSTWAADTGAYFVGNAMGKRRLAPKISPKKSVEGAVGGTALAIMVGAAYAPVVQIAPWQGALIGLGAAVLSILGDLAESALKRYVGVKDSGNLLPGHGGVLDRFDSSFFVLPFVYYVVRLFFLP